MPDAQMDEFLRKHIGLARKAAWNFSQRYGVDYNDAFSDAQLLLWRAAKTWHAVGGSSFTSWYLRWAGMGLYNRQFHKKRLMTVSYEELTETTRFDVIDTQPYMEIDAESITEGWTEPRKSIFDLYYIQGKSAKQCGELLGMTQQGVTRQCHIIEEILRNQLSDGSAKAPRKYTHKVKEEKQ